MPTDGIVMKVVEVEGSRIQRLEIEFAESREEPAAEE